MNTNYYVSKDVTGLLGENTQPILNELLYLLQEELGENYVVHIQTKHKMNMELTGVCICKQDESVAPIIYLEPLISQLEPDVSDINESARILTKRILECYSASRKPTDEENTIMQEISDRIDKYEEVKEFLSFRVVNKKRQSDLDKIPYYPFLEDVLIAICYLNYEIDKDHAFGIRVSLKHLDMWGISKDKLYQDTMKNMRKKCSPCYTPLLDVVSEYLLEDDSVSQERYDEMMQESTDSSNPMAKAQIISFEKAHYGAAVLLFEDFMKSVYETFGPGYVLPSSVHEILYVPAESFDVESYDDFCVMVRTANLTSVNADEFLSHQVLWFDENGLSLASRQLQ